jgi:hypothetical protein
MTYKRTDLFWGLAIVASGVFLLLVSTGVLPDLAENTWAIVLTCAAVVFLAGYVLAGWRKWYLLFPGAVSAAIAALIWLVQSDVAETLATGLFMALISAPFWVAYLADSQANGWAIIPGGEVAAIGVALLFESVVPERVFAALILLGIAAPFLLVYLHDRRQWWALIPSYVLAVIGLIFLFLGEDSAWMPAAIMFSIAAPFLLVFLLNRKHWWALVPASVLGLIGLALLIDAVISEASWAPALIVFGIALPFYAIYILRRDQWWALLPAAILTGAGLATIIATGDISQDKAERYAGAVVLASVALVFAFLWWRRKVYQTSWAGAPSLVLAVGALAVLFVGLSQAVFWSLALIALGGWILFRNLRSPQKG